jgi:hypothetical protein
MCRMSWKSGSLNLLEPCGPHPACYGTRLPLYAKNQWLNSNWSISWTFRLTHRLSMANCAVWFYWPEAAINCLLVFSDEWLQLHVAKGILIRAYKFKTDNKIHPPLRIFASQNRCHHFTEPWGSRKSTFRKIGLRDTNRRFKRNYRLNMYAVLLRNAVIYLQITKIQNQVHCHINVCHFLDPKSRIISVYTKLREV